MRIALLALLLVLVAGCAGPSAAYFDDSELFSLPPEGYVEGRTLTIRTYRPTSLAREVRELAIELVGEEIHLRAPEVVDISLPRRDRDHAFELPASHLTPSLAERIFWINPDGTKVRLHIEDTR